MKYRIIMGLNDDGEWEVNLMCDNESIHSIVCKEENIHGAIDECLDELDRAFQIERRAK